MSEIYNFDETSIFIEDDNVSTIEHRGSTCVQIQSNGFEKMRYTLILAASAIGKKIKPTIIVKGAKITIEEKENCFIATNNISWMTSELFVKWIDFIFPPMLSNRLLLVFDSARQHIAKSSINHLNHRKIIYSIIPGGLTSLLQSADISWMKPFKNKFRECIDQWKEIGPFELTKSNKVRPPSISIIVEWVKHSWNSIELGIVQHSFEVAFIGNFEELLICKNPVYGNVMIQNFNELRTTSIDDRTNNEEIFPEIDYILED